jgi:hypothetical protein
LESALLFGVFSFVKQLDFYMQQIENKKEEEDYSKIILIV